MKHVFSLLLCLFLAGMAHAMDSTERLLLSPRNPKELVVDGQVVAKLHRYSGELHKLIKENDIKGLEVALEKEGIQVNDMDDAMNTPFHWAAERGNVEAISLLCKAGADKDIKGQHGMTALIRAVCFCPPKNKSAVVQLFIKYGAKVWMQDEEGMTALHYASMNGFFEVVNELCACKEIGINVQAYKDGATPLHCAAFHNKPDIVKALLEVPDSALDCLTTTEEGVSPLHIASYKGHLGVVKLLLEAGADKTLQSKKGQTAEQLAEEAGHKEVAEYLATFEPSNKEESHTSEQEKEADVRSNGAKNGSKKGKLRMLWKGFKKGHRK